MTDIQVEFNSGPYSWDNQAKYYPATGKDIQYFRGVLNNGTWVDSLLFYGKDNKLEGILYYFPFDLYPEKKGNVTVLVRKDRWRRGIATMLLTEGLKQFPIDLSKQEYTAFGKRFIDKYLLTHTTK